VSGRVVSGRVVSGRVVSGRVVSGRVTVVSLAPIKGILIDWDVSVWRKLKFTLIT